MGSFTIQKIDPGMTNRDLYIFLKIYYYILKTPFFALLSRLQINPELFHNPSAQELPEVCHEEQSTGAPVRTNKVITKEVPGISRVLLGFCTHIAVY